MPSIASRSSVMRVPVMQLDPFDEGADSPPPLPLPLHERADCPPRVSQGEGGVFQEGWGELCSPHPSWIPFPPLRLRPYGVGYPSRRRGGGGGEGRWQVRWGGA